MKTTVEYMVELFHLQEAVEPIEATRRTADCVLSAGSRVLSISAILSP